MPDNSEDLKAKDTETAFEVALDRVRKELGEKTFLVLFRSGHYKKITGRWKGDSVWGHYIKPNGMEIHINRAEVEYIEEI